MQIFHSLEQQFLHRKGGKFLIIFLGPTQNSAEKHLHHIKRRWTETVENRLNFSHHFRGVAIAQLWPKSKRIYLEKRTKGPTILGAPVWGRILQKNWSYPCMGQFDVWCKNLNLVTLVLACTNPSHLHPTLFHLKNVSVLTTIT